MQPFEKDWNYLYDSQRQDYVTNKINMLHKTKNKKQSKPRDNELKHGIRVF